ncbi:AlbA family DNA-binding domain-containing protein [Nocardioides sp. AX2bis]|uniref:AlbA family DNA-binding domain-containing protein n=1 Tax=Nocardioides sp. AX2bis TaxID=2653157 RepID=UPI0012F2499B|nr:ATP-binding protein [Nocardioides sp. AX2bis]VXB44386.1 ATP-binding protein [Nocardioides sp. AX2bis]
MPIWRSAALEAVLETSLDESGLTEAVIKRLVEVGARETDQLDFKLRPHLSESGTVATQADRSWGAEQEFAKDVCAFANHLGGLILVGIRDENDIATRAEPTVADPGAVTQRLRQALLNYSSPSPQFYSIAIESADGGYYLALIVPPSPAAPHAVQGATGNTRRPLQYPVRDGTDTRWLLEHEVAERYRARFAGRSARQALRVETLEAGLGALQRAEDEIWLYLAIVPESPAPQRLDQHAVETITNWWREYGFASPLSRIFNLHGTPTAAPERVTISGSAARVGGEDTDPRDAYLELYVDGRVFAATPITTRSSREDRACIGELTLADDTILLADIAVSWANYQAGSWGSAEVVIGLAKQGLVTEPFDTPLTIQSASNEGLHRIRGTRAIPRPIQARSAVDLDQGQDQVGRLRAARNAHTVLLHHFGLSESGQLDADGAIIAWGWGRQAQDVERWATDRGLPLRPRYSQSL